LEDYQALLSELENESDPKKRLELFIQLTVDQRDSVAQWGCPIGTFCAELHKQGGALADSSTKLFAANLKWIEAQFTDIGKYSNAKDLALHLLAGIQGAGLLAHSFGDPEIIVREADQLKEWIRDL
jgi:TetR/AcrR family transcriptional repressor of nem operon